MRGIILTLTGAFLLMACSDDSGQSVTKKDGGQTQKDRSIAVGDKAVTPDTTAKTCGPGIYPCGPYGAKAGDILKNHKFMGFRDPKDLCKDPKDKVPDTTKSVALSMQTFFQGDATCPTKKKKLLWVLGSAGWCGTCIKEVKTIQAALSANQIDSRVAFFNVLVDGKTVGGNPDEALLKAFLSTVKGTFPAAYDPTRSLTSYFTASYFPFNMLVDLSNMKIYYAKNGDSVSNIGTKIAQFFAK